MPGVPAGSTFAADRRREPTGPPGLAERLLRPFGDVRPGEAPTVLLMLEDLFLILVGYYILKTVREPLILASGGAEMKSMRLDVDRSGGVRLGVLVVDRDGRTTESFSLDLHGTGD